MAADLLLPSQGLTVLQVMHDLFSYVKFLGSDVLRGPRSVGDRVSINTVVAMMKSIYLTGQQFELFPCVNVGVQL